MCNSNELYNCLVCQNTKGYVKKYLNCSCSYFICVDCKNIWINKNDGIFKCLYGCKIDPRRINNIYPFLCSVNYIQNKLQEFILNNFNNMVGKIIYSLISVIFTIFLTVPIQFMCSTIIILCRYILYSFVVYPIHIALLITKILLLLIVTIFVVIFKLMDLIYNCNSYVIYSVTGCLLVCSYYMSIL